MSQIVALPILAETAAPEIAIAVANIEPRIDPLHILAAGVVGQIAADEIAREHEEVGIASAPVRFFGTLRRSERN